MEFKVVPIGNSRGVHLPKAVLDKYAIRDAGREDWSDLDGTLNDGLDKEPW